ncbi:hypothetical protein PCANC_00857 [Puccinia coronata f. sp. avenae]|uniref:Uncharacterized protein n=1 Tax=Puccinia coronata f. sp. avenae TaxID=200324 RepID=A0A2N5W7R9_9BASI|nr:hypothetical protein PCANC_00857 [Puccinia coronata f. sp. avenae]
MPIMCLLTVKKGCAGSFIQAGFVATTAVLRKREPQKTNSAENGTAGIAGLTSVNNKAPLVVYASDSIPTSSNQGASSPPISSRSALFVILSGASALSIITVAFVLLYRRYKAHKLVISRLHPSEEVRLSAGRTSIEKSQIRHVTHDEQKQRYLSLFGVPAGYLRPKSRMSLAPQPTIRSIQAGRYFHPPTDLRDDTENDFRSSPSFEIQSENETPSRHISTPENEPRLPTRDRKTRLISFVDESLSQISGSRSENDDELRFSRFAPRLPNLVARFKSIKPKIIHKSKSINRIDPLTSSIQNANEFEHSVTAVAEADSDDSQPRSPSIVPTPPNYIKNSSDENKMIQKPLDLAIVTDRLERHMTIQRPSFHGRGDSYFWKSPPRTE